MLTVYPTEGYDSFVSLAEADAYLASVGHSDWAAKSVEAREASLRRGTQYVWSRRLIPEALTPTLHANVAAATSEAAVRDSRGTLFRDIDHSKVVIEKTVGPITTRYAPPGSRAGEIEIPIISALLFGLVYTGGGYGPVVFERA